MNVVAINELCRVFDVSNSDLLKHWDDTYKFIKEAKYVCVCVCVRVSVCVCVSVYIALVHMCEFTSADDLDLTTKNLLLCVVRIIVG